MTSNISHHHFTEVQIQTMSVYTYTNQHHVIC